MPHSKRTATGVFGGVLGLIGLSTVAGVLVTATVTPAIAVSGSAASGAIEMFDNMPSYLKIDELMLPTTLYVTDGDGNDRKLTEFYDQNRIPVTFDEVNPVVYDAILSSEDKNFYDHGGIDLLGTVSALVGNATSGSNRGGSSITQQYVKNVLQQNCESDALLLPSDEQQAAVTACYNESTVNTGTAGYERKLQEMRYAIQLEKEYSKDEILIGYLNIAHFGGSVYGIGAAAQYYFGTTVDKLNIRQSAALAGMVQEPNTLRIDRATGTNSAEDGYSRTKVRQNYVLTRMHEDGKITDEEYKLTTEGPITTNITRREQGCSQATGAEFFCEYVVSLIRTDEAFGETPEDRAAALRRGGLKVYTSLDTSLQRAAREAISVVPGYVDYMDLGASGIQVEVGTGRVLSMVQNRDYAPSASEDGTTTPVNYNVRTANGGGGHSAGSTYKMFSLVNWLEQGHSVNEIVNGRVGDKTVDRCDGSTQLVETGEGKARDGSNKIGNFEGNRGYNGTPYNFTRDSLNSGFIAMAEKISVCSTNEVAGKLGVTWDDGTPLNEVPAWSNDPANAPYNVLGSSAVAPIDMANAYAAIASNGIVCEAQAIDKVVDANGAEQAIPETKCERAVSEAVASTTAYALESVMQGGGTGSGARTYDGVPIFGKTGIHQFLHTWMIGSSTEVATAVWVGNVKGNERLENHYEAGYRLSRIRNSVWPNMQRAANAEYGGQAFPEPDRELTKRTFVNLPNVVGQDVDAATATLRGAGFSVSVGEPVDATEAEGTIVAQTPGAGRVVAGTTVTISPSNGEGVTVPGVGGTPQEAVAALQAAGFSNFQAQCTDNEGAPPQGVVTGTDPAAGSTVSRDDTITVQFQSPDCDGNGNGGGPGNGNGDDGD
jgi:membrane peptidoglycan carboxypeptidase